MHGIEHGQTSIVTVANLHHPDGDVYLGFYTAVYGWS